MNFQKPDWMQVNARVRKRGGWPRVELPDGSEGTVIEVSWPFEFRVRWDNHEGWEHGVSHPAWHADPLHCSVIPAQPEPVSEEPVQVPVSPELLEALAAFFEGDGEVSASVVGEQLGVEWKGDDRAFARKMGAAFRSLGGDQ